MCLAIFAVNYDPVSGSTLTVLQNDDPDNDQVAVNYDGVNSAKENVSPHGDTDTDDNHLGADDDEVYCTDVTAPEHGGADNFDVH